MPLHQQDTHSNASQALRALSSEPYSMPRWSRPPPQADRGPTRRRRWAAVALTLSLLAVVVEAAFHLCGSLLFDPLPDVITGIAYAWVLFFLAFNEAAIGAATQPSKNPLILAMGPERAVGFARAGTGVALLVAGMVTWMFLPFLAAAPLLIISVVGTLLMAPCLDLIVLIAQFRALHALWRARADGTSDTRTKICVTLLGAAALFFLIVRPTLIGRWTAQALHTTGDAQGRAFAGLRALHGESTMLDLTYRRNPPYWVCLGYQASIVGLWPWAGYGWRTGLGDDVPAARRDYFLMTGTPFENVPRPDSVVRQSSRSDSEADDVAEEEQGGYAVGRPIPGVSLDSSAMSFTADAQTETTVGDWTLTFRNDTLAPQEARADILLPPGGTCHAVSLWINGVEEPAAFSSPQKVRAAYQQVAVVQRRDPLLVTMPAPDHLLAQCFPVPPNATVKINLGITAPLTWRTGASNVVGASPRLLWTAPTFGTVNFAVPPRLTHALTLKTASGATIPAPTLRGADLFSPPTIALTALRIAPRVGDTLSPGITRTDDPTKIPAAPVNLYLLRDASQGMNDALISARQSEIQRTLAALPQGSHIVSEDTHGDTVPLEQQPHYVGGTDPAPALEQTLRRAREAQSTTHRHAVVVFLHAASPANVSDLTNVRRELQRCAALGANGPTLVSIALAPQAPDAVATDLAGFSDVSARRALPGDDGALTDALRFAVQTARTQTPSALTCPLGGHAPAINGIALPSNAAEPNSPAPWAHLQQSSQTTAAWYRANAIANFDQSVDLRIAAGAPAARARLITPLTSAVVLEAAQQYRENGLADPQHRKNDPTATKPADPPNYDAPEPPAGLLAAIGLCALLGSRRFLPGFHCASKKASVVAQLR